MCSVTFFGVSKLLKYTYSCYSQDTNCFEYFSCNTFCDSLRVLEFWFEELQILQYPLFITDLLFHHFYVFFNDTLTFYVSIVNYFNRHTKFHSVDTNQAVIYKPENRVYFLLENVISQIKYE